MRGRRYAGKKLHKIFYERDVPPADKAAISQRFEEECRRVTQLKHPNIVQMNGVYFHPRTRQPTLVMELMDTSLRHYLEEHPAVPPTVKHSVLLGVASGLVYLHTLSPPLGPIIHRDLTANNVLLNLGEEMIAKIADLGQARIAGRIPAQMAQQQLTKCPGNADHMPPEAQIDDPEYDTALDIFSFGVVMLHTLAHEWPKPLSKLESAFRVRSEVDRRKTYLDKIEGSLLKPLVVECLGDSAESRPVAGELTGTLKLAMKLHPQMQSIREAHKEVLHQVHDLQQQLQEQQVQEQQQARQLSFKNQELIHQMKSMTEVHAQQVEDLQQQLQAQQTREQQQTKVFEQQVRQLELKNQELARQHNEQKQRLEQDIQLHVQEKELLQQQLQDQQRLISSVHQQPQPQLHSRQWEDDQYSPRPRQPQGVGHTLHYPWGTSQVLPALAHPVYHQNVLCQNMRSESTTYKNTGPEKVNITQQMMNLYQQYPQLAPQHTITDQQFSVTQEMRKLFQEYPELAGLPPQQKDTEQPASDDDIEDLYGAEQPTSDDDSLDLYGDDSNPVPVDTQPSPPMECSFDVPAPTFRFNTPAPASEIYSGITKKMLKSGGQEVCVYVAYIFTFYSPPSPSSASFSFHFLLSALCPEPSVLQGLSPLLTGRDSVGIQQVQGIRT